jgi:23S rRNA (cytosine1962-C5)-methyltransferase
MNLEELQTTIQKASELRSGFMDDHHLSAFRLFNGFIEGIPDLAVDIYARTLVIYNYANPPESIQDMINPISTFLSNLYPWIR